MRLTYILTTLLLLGFLGGCGQKGDLYLPGKGADSAAKPPLNQGAQ